MAGWTRPGDDECRVLTQELVNGAAAAAGLPRLARFVEVTGSTNSDLIEAGQAGAPEWSVLVAGEQRAGRGRLGRGWSSPGGQSLSVSVLLRPALPASETTLLSLAAAVSLATACERACGVGVRCKWPNDLMVGDRKLGGILVEGTVRDERVSHVVVGAGVNLTQSPEDFPRALRESAASVVTEGGRPNPQALLGDYLRCLRAMYGEGGAGLRDRVSAAYPERCDTLGRAVRGRTRSGATVVGIATGIGELGELLVRDPATGATTSITFGEVDHLR